MSKPAIDALHREHTHMWSILGIIGDTLTAMCEHLMREARNT